MNSVPDVELKFHLRLKRRDRDERNSIVTLPVSSCQGFVHGSHVIVTDQRSATDLVEQGCYGQRTNFRKRWLQRRKHEVAKRLSLASAAEAPSCLPYRDSNSVNGPQYGFDTLVVPDSDEDASLPSPSQCFWTGYSFLDSLPLFLSLEEAVYLSCHSRLNVSCQNEPLHHGKFWKFCVERDANFFGRFFAYHFFRSRGWIVRNGQNYGVDFVLYVKHPAAVHSSYGVLVYDEEACKQTGKNAGPANWKNLTSSCRTLSVVSKELLLFIVRRTDKSAEQVDRSAVHSVKHYAAKYAISAFAFRSRPFYHRLFCTAMNCKCLRWAFRLGCWEPSFAEWKYTLQSIQADEMRRINCFAFRKDALAAAAGRLLIRQALRRCLNCSWENLILERTEKGKPVLAAGSATSDVSFNISHHGDFVILATSTSSNCGVDVMSVDLPRSISVDAYMKLMRKQFSVREWEGLMHVDNDWMKMWKFYRYWCLKESYIKAVGVGIHNKLSLLDFAVSPKPLAVDNPVTSTQLWLDGTLGNEWFFEESLLDSNHIATVCINVSTLTICCGKLHGGKGLSFAQLSWSDLMEGATVINDVDDRDCAKLFDKLKK